MKLVSAAECVRRLRQAGIYKGKESYFSQLVKKGVIPHHFKNGSPKKWFVLDEVKQALKDWEDPSRDAQREANEKRRAEAALIGQSKQIMKMYDEAWVRLNTSMTLDDFTLTGEITEEEARQDIVTSNTVNGTLAFVLESLCSVMPQEQWPLLIEIVEHHAHDVALLQETFDEA